jgi:hypothetical protein
MNPPAAFVLSLKWAALNVAFGNFYETNYLVILLTLKTICDNIGSTWDGMLPVSF